ncbi:SEL1-like repeat protein [Caballeronia catudaia]
MKKTFILSAVATVILLNACERENSVSASVPDLKEVRANLAFTCSHEVNRLPSLDGRTESLFAYGRYLYKQDGEKNFNQVARYYRIAAAHDHYKANHNLQLLISQGLADSPDGVGEVLGLAEQLIKQGVPGGYYDIGHYLELGYGLKQDSEMSLRYFRRAADLGNPDAQFYVGEKLSPHDKAPEVAKKLYACAADQGNGEAALSLGLMLQIGDRQFVDAVRSLQIGVKAGNRTSASMLAMGFETASAEDDATFFALPKDPERVGRYRKIADFLSSNESRNPKVPDIDKIVPLPPAKLPPWDGTFEWQKQQDAAVPPPKPSEELVERLAKEKSLDPATGLPLSEQQKSAMATKVPLNTTVRAMEVCPQSGVWRACPPSGYVATSAERSFQKGEKLPLLEVVQPRAIGMLDSMLGVRRMHTDGVWRLISYGNEA